LLRKKKKTNHFGIKKVKEGEKGLMIGKKKLMGGLNR